MKKSKRTPPRREQFYPEVTSFSSNEELKAMIDDLRGKCSIGEYFRSLVRREHAGRK